MFNNYSCNVLPKKSKNKRQKDRTWVGEWEKLRLKWDNFFWTNFIWLLTKAEKRPDGEVPELNR